MFQKTQKGLWHYNGLHLIFYGNGSVSKTDLENFFGHKLCSLHQTHSDIAVEAFCDEELKGDAHFSDRPGEGLLIKTADCIPLLMSDAQNGYAFAIHAGWRGVAQKILESSLDTFFSSHLFEAPPRWTAYIGPHIHHQSFEVGTDVANEILNSIKDQDRIAYQTPHPTEKNKVFVDLNKVMRRQLLENSITNIEDVTVDTFTNPEFASYRRDKGSKHRNWSLIYKPTFFNEEKWVNFLNDSA